MPTFILGVITAQQLNYISDKVASKDQKQTLQSISNSEHKQDR